ncbi:DNA alkylation repair enzyme [Mucilaginibacter sp. PPCGB 2223]|uniref:DNA alkylation repair protein n=1 Tax=Mucilaginibacter sp. PPCGB 2223 TaxID=1886027 RepID=UPI00082685E4|nr:DNA alkylation repair protein [Mucilaginibacter sp. PPCGB 2223]OCX51367.1 DNA alkylation repair enzyme [Mucilaginibacter sp. PPCGB 2223]
MTELNLIIDRLTQTEHGFKHIVEAGDKLLADDTLPHLQIAGSLINHKAYQARMLGVYLLGKLSAGNTAALALLKTNVANDANWRVQEMLAKAFDQYCKDTGYETALPEIKLWLGHRHHNLNRAVVEGLRIWTGRPYFKSKPQEAIKLIARLRAHDSEYVRKSVGNALRDIGKKHTELINKELNKWDLSDPKVAFVHKLATG